MNTLPSKYTEWGKTVKKTLIDKEIKIIQLSEHICISRFAIMRALSSNRPNEKVAKRISEYLGINAP